MSSAAVVIMASEPAAGRPKKLHPLFAALQAGGIASENSTDTEADAEPSQPDIIAADQRKRKPDGGPGDDTSSAQAPRRRGRPPKRRKSSPALSGIANPRLLDPRLLDPGFDTVASNGEICTPAEEPTVCRPPMRVLQLNPKTGTIGSPPRPKDASKKAVGTKASVVVVARYGREDDPELARISARIGDVLAGRARIFPLPASPAKTGTRKLGASPVAANSKDGPKKRGRPKKSTHPFFTGGLPKTPTAAAEPSADTTATSNSSNAKGSSMVTSAAAAAKYYASLASSPHGQLRPSSGPRMPQFGVKNGILRVPGACLPQWPWKGTVHVHPPELVVVAAATAPVLPPRKRKGQTVQIEAGESVLAQMLERLQLRQVADEVRNANSSGSDELPPAPAGLRLPQKHLMSGRKMQGRVAPQLRTSHAGVQSLFGTLRTTLSAFDQHQCEMQSWTQKYAPTCAAEVLQSGREPQMLRDWLAALKVVAVDTGAPGEGVAAPATMGAKKKRKKNKLDGFIVSSDEEDNDSVATGDGLDGEAADWLASGLYGLQKKTVVREGINNSSSSSSGGARLTNAMVLSGPHGCGKTAAVYAAARELGFEVFEINASSRRSGKDVIDRIGDMTRNHLVQHRQKAEEGGEADESEDADGKKQAKEAKEAKQAKMSAFFQPKSVRSKVRATNEEGGGSTRKPTSQKQSLILLEEADLLYEEDRQFWTTVTGLMAQSKRPFVMTCNDETLLPLASLRLHGILRLEAAPTAEAVDRLLLAAACEGHVLRREAVEALYDARSQDLRAALTELQFWCQLGVGDRRGGFDWFVQRWPEGIDLDEEQQVVRVVSEDTFVGGMGWVGEEGGEGEAEELEEELVQQTWHNWELDLGQWEDSLDLGSWAEGWDRKGGDGGDGGEAERGQMLEACSRFADVMSDADMVSMGVLATGTRVRLDATMPEMAARTRDDFVAGGQLVGQPTEAAYMGGSSSSSSDDSQLRLPLATALRCAAKRQLRSMLDDIGTAGGWRLVKDRLGCVDTTQAAAAIRYGRRDRRRPADLPLRRIDFSLAFDAIATPMGAYGETPGPAAHLDPSVFDRNLEPIVTDVAPFVRGIVVYDGHRKAQRQRISRFLVGGGEGFRREGPRGSGSDSASDYPPPKRMRTTRAALSALEGGPRSAMRRERWFLADMNPVLVARTAGEGWAEAVEKEKEEREKKSGEVAEETKSTPVALDGDDVDEVDDAIPVQTTPMLVWKEVQTATSLSADFSSAQRPPRRRKIIMSSPGREDCGQGQDG
ncbi:hmg-i/hmg-y, DNA-binding protein [Grosmannia clavigera kw1407]|uniref:Hmg-i/hmg-y, DNA-binding protein n=1 Tax=Grosmannia clavigera (strain kw1407 / UAMH 11150) TaxID=655863 RepID=F0XR44_GROCL|nr:hmg-i/hmg-y, DNA-binding protein [Grosmannia clavigera kw1407]EFW99817.1 hmg-i/hmg-y, DNA-binding protein [Grosmannia clavigera kw1407]